ASSKPNSPGYTATTTPSGSTKASATSPPKTNTPAEAKPSAPPAKPDSTPLTTPELRSTGNYAKIFHSSGGWVFRPPTGAFSQTHLGRLRRLHLDQGSRHAA